MQSQDRREALLLYERLRIVSQRVGELEAVLKEFIEDIEAPGASVVWDDGYADLIHTYEKVCKMLGMTPQGHEKEDEPDHDHEGGYYDDLDIYH